MHEGPPPVSIQRTTFDHAAAVVAVRKAVDESVAVKREFAETCADEIAEAAERLVECFERGGKVLLFGNGGSATDAQHIASELVVRLRRDRRAIPAMALGVSASDITAIANDWSFDQVFARLVEAHGEPGDVAIALSTSGNSPNIVAAVEQARRSGLYIMALTGKGGGKIADLVDLEIRVPSSDTARIQESHITAGHLLCQLVEDTLFPEDGSR